MFLNESTPYELSGKCGIYKITNLTNGKVYIGQTRDLHRRAIDYMRIQDPLYPIKGRQIELAIRNYGIENFTFEVLKFCDFYELSKWEEYYAMKYKSLDPVYGYNTNPTFVTSRPLDIDPKVREKMSKSHTGLKEEPRTKRKKSNFILAVTEGIIFVCDSGKLFGSFAGGSKDLVKNCLRQPCRFLEYRLYYEDYAKRNEILDKQIQKIHTGGRNVFRIDQDYIKIGQYLNEISQVVDFTSLETRHTPDGKYVIGHITYENAITQIQFE